MSQSIERCLEEISLQVKDAGEPISYRTLSIHSQAPSKLCIEALTSYYTDDDSVEALILLIKRVAVSKNGDKTETAAAKHDPRARILSLAVGVEENEKDVLCHHIYALFDKPSDTSKDADKVATMATACWAQERQARNKVLSSVVKQEPLPSAAKVLYASSVVCEEATARQAFGDDHGEETISAFDAISASITQKTSSSSFFKSTGKKGHSKASRNDKVRKSSKAEAKELDMAKVLTVDSDDDDDDEEDETDTPVFVKKKSSRTRIISDDEENETPEPRKTASKSRNVKRKLNASPTDTKKAKDTTEKTHSPQRAESESEGDDSVEALFVATKKRVLVSKTRINEQGYMVTEKTYEEVDLTPEEMEAEQEAAKKSREDKKKNAAAKKVVKTAKEAKLPSGPPKQRDLRSFFGAK